MLLLRTGRSSRDRIRAAETLGATRPPGAREALERALGDRAATVRQAAVEALRQLGDTAALPALRAAARDSNAGVGGDGAPVVRA
ncbi:MAG: HEAT repeat domain-containing protein, partial [Polyangiales bacterium]